MMLVELFKEEGMAQTRRNARVTRTGSNAMGIQKKINEDYEILAKDYGKLFVELWRIPLTKYLLGGLALGALVPLLKNEKVIDFFKSVKSDVNTEVTI